MRHRRRPSSTIQVPLDGASPLAVTVALRGTRRLKKGVSWHPRTNSGVHRRWRERFEAAVCQVARPKRCSRHTSRDSKRCEARGQPLGAATNTHPASGGAADAGALIVERWITADALRWQRTVDGAIILVGRPVRASNKKMKKTLAKREREALAPQTRSTSSAMQPWRQGRYVAARRITEAP